MILELLRQALQAKASDVLLSVGTRAMFRIYGELTPYGDALRPHDTEEMARTLMSEEQWQRFGDLGELDFSFSIPGTSRYRVNAFRQRGCVSIVARIVPDTVPKFDELGLPRALLNFTELEHGLVLVTGPTGSGKSTTLASLIDHINQTQKRHIITLEDPIEYLHKHHQSVIDQREVGLDTKGFAPALRAALRQDPDVILVGEMRDLETISTAITAAETGHLVFGTLHTSDTIQTVDRVVDVFPSNQQPQVRVQLAGVLQGIVSQRLFRTKSGSGRTACVEILVNTPAVANLIRTEKVHQIKSVLQTGRSVGMQSMEMHLRELIAGGLVPDSVLRAWTQG